MLALKNCFYLCCIKRSVVYTICIEKLSRAMFCEIFCMKKFIFLFLCICTYFLSKKWSGIFTFMFLQVSIVKYIDLFLNDKFSLEDSFLKLNILWNLSYWFTNYHYFRKWSMVFSADSFAVEHYFSICFSVE